MTDFAKITATIAALLDMVVAGIHFAQGNIEKAIFFLVLANTVWLTCVIAPYFRDKDNH